MLAPLPLRVTPVARETLTSFLTRMAAVNGLSGKDFAVDMGFSLRKIIDLDEAATRRLAALGGLDDQGLEEMISWTGRNVGGVRTAFCGEVFMSRALRNPRVRGCPVCLREDAAAHDGPFTEAMAMRGDWQFREVSLCVRHQHPLVQLWEEGVPLRRHDTGIRLREIADQLFNGGLDRDRVTPSPYDEWLDARLESGRDDTWLAGQTLYGATIFCRLLGAELLRLEVPRSRDEPEDLRAAQAAGFAVARHGEDAIRSALRDLVNLAVGARDEPGKALGDLYGMLSTDYVNEDGFAVFRDLLRERVLEVWPIAAGEVVIGEILPERRLHSVTTAVHETGLTPETIEEVLVDAGALAKDDNRPRSRKTFDAHRYSALLAMLPQLVSRARMQKLLGASRAELMALADEGILVPRIALPTVRLSWHPRDGFELLAELQANSVPIAPDDEAWEGIQHARNRTGLRLKAIFNAIREGSLRVGCRAGASGYPAFHVNKNEIDGIANEAGLLPSPDLTPLSTFSRLIGLRAKGRFLALVAAGHTPATRKKFQKSGGERIYMTPEDIAAFHTRFVTASTLAAETGDDWRTIQARLKASGVRPFSPKGEDFGRLYLRDDAEKALPRRG